MGLEAGGETLGELFVNAALALRTVLLGDRCLVPDLVQEVELPGEDSEELLVAWLSEILYLLETRGLCPCAFEIDEIDGKRLRGRIRGLCVVECAIELEREVKAVTWHRLSVSCNEGRWRARVYLDL